MNPVKVKKKVRTCLEKNQLVEARTLIITVCKKIPSDADAWHLLSAINGMLGLNEEAEACARKVIKLQPGAIAAHNNLGSSLLAQDKLNEAEIVLESALKLNPNDPQALNNSGSLHLKYKEFNEAAELFRRAIATNPGYTEAHNNLGSALLGMDDAHAAIESIENALRLSADYPDALYNYGQAEYLLGKNDVALNLYGKALNLQPGHTAALLGAAEIFKENDVFEQAKKCYESAIDVAPDLAAAYVGYGTLMQKQSNHTKAIELLDRALEIDPNCVDALHYYGASMSELGKIDVAAEYFSRALELDPACVQARHMLAAIGDAPIPEIADPRYVAGLFDGYAANFDEHLVDGLEYRAPDVLFELVTPLLGDPDHQVDVLDLGCGTGLCAHFFKNWSRSITGVDLSRKMIVKAEERGLYNNLILGDLLEPLSAGKDSYDLILAADVFIYIGKLENVFMGCAQALRQGGILAFSIELLAEGGSDYNLHAGGRYAQSRKYIERLADRSALSVHTSLETVLRKEKGEAALGIIYVLNKSS